MKNFILKIRILLLVACCLLLVASPANGAGSASLYLSPPSGSYAVGGTFSVKIKVNSGGEAINAAEGTLIFNPDELQVVSLSKSGSIFSLWTTAPTFSNFTGEIAFGGGTPSGFTGTSGTIITITFKAKSVGSSNVNFSSGSVLAADGKGTNILGNMNGGVYTLKSKITAPPAEEVPPETEYISPTMPSGAPGAPVISSSTHPELNKWYPNNNPEFSWKLPADVTAVKLLINEIPTTLPIILYTPPISEKKLEDLEDGVWYFHIRFENQYGWGGITHRKVLIDTEPPETFELEVDNEGDPTNPTPILHFDTTDSLSGVEYYEVKIGEGDTMPITTAALKINPYKMPPQAPGKRSVIVKAVDKAGNSTPATTNVVITPIETPVITDIPQTVRPGDILIIKGTSLYPDAVVTVFVKKEGEEVETRDVVTDKEGNWFFTYDKSLKKGTYQVWAEITDNRGAKSNPTEKFTIAATLPIILKFGEITIEYLTIIITLVTLLVFLISIVFFALRQLFFWRKRVKKETKEVEESVRGAFKALREEVQKQIEYLDKKAGLTKAEKETHDKLQKALNIFEELIGKEIEDVEKELE